MKKVINHYKENKEGIDEIMISIAFVTTVGFFVWLAITVSHITGM
jgi:hypothetical protein